MERKGESREEEGGKNFEMKDFRARNRFVSSRESMPMKDMGTTNDATTIEFHANQSIQIKK